MGLSAFTNGLSNTLTNGLPNGLVPLDGVGLEELEDGFELLNTPISVLNPTSSDYGNQKLTTSTKSNNCGNNSVGGCSSGIARVRSTVSLTHRFTTRRLTAVFDSRPLILSNNRVTSKVNCASLVHYLLLTERF